MRPRPIHDHPARACGDLARPPHCDDDTAKYRSVKGGNLVDLPVDFAQARRAVDATDEPAQVGFRCAYRAPKEP
ncbi:hypothetical protein BH11MYX4_BH11MYX4_69950 [soil metagenome]